MVMTPTTGMTNSGLPHSREAPQPELPASSVSSRGLDRAAGVTIT